MRAGVEMQQRLKAAYENAQHYLDKFLLPENHNK
jgi:hypothetical protein